MKVIGHKGGGASVPGNTAASLRHAIELGVDAVEIDIWATADRQFVVFHDAHLGRITGHAGWTNSLTSHELRVLPVRDGSTNDRSPERLLLLPEALELMGDLELILEIKRTRHQLDRFAWMEEELWGVLSRHGAQERTTVISFDHQSLLELRRIAPTARVGMLFAGEWVCLWDEIAALEPNALVPHWAQTTEELVSRAHAANLEVYPWAVDHRELMEQLAAMRVDGIITDHPEMLLDVRRQQASRYYAEQSAGGK
jgi:glycerophosphoryl diester phosphodiesterase